MNDAATSAAIYRDSSRAVATLPLTTTIEVAGEPVVLASRTVRLAPSTISYH